MATLKAQIRMRLRRLLCHIFMSLLRRWWRDATTAAWSDESGQLRWCFESFLSGSEYGLGQRSLPTTSRRFNYK